MKKHIFLITLVILALQGCARYQVNVDSISSPEANTKNRYILLSGVKGVENSDLQYLEYSNYVERALASLGYIKAADFLDANIAIFLMYGIDDPETHQFSYSLPTYGQTGISSSNTYGTVNTYGNTATYSETTNYTPTYGVTGSTIHIGERITYFRYMKLDAIDLDEYRKTEKEVQLWKTTVTSTGSSNDLREVFPILVAVSKPYIGTNTGKKVTISISENDKRVTEIKALKN